MRSVMYSSKPSDTSNTPDMAVGKLSISAETSAADIQGRLRVLPFACEDERGLSNMVRRVRVIAHKD